MVKDTKLNEKEEFVVQGAVIADEFLDRKTGKSIGESTKPLIGSEYIVVDDDETGLNKQVRLDLDAVEFLVPKKVPLSEIEHEPSTDNTIITVKPGLLNSNYGYHINFEVESTGSHFGASFDVLPYNSAQCLVVFYMLENNDVKECFAHLGNDGSLVIDIPVVMTPESQNTVIHYKRVI